MGKYEAVKKIEKFQKTEHPNVQGTVASSSSKQTSVPELMFVLLFILILE